MSRAYLLPRLLNGETTPKLRNIGLTSVVTKSTSTSSHTIDFTGKFPLHSLSSHVTNQEPCVLQANLRRCRLHFHCPIDQAPAPLLVSKAQAPPIVLIVNRNSFAPHISTLSLRQRCDLLVHATHIRNFAAQQRCVSLLNSYAAFLP